MKIKRQKSFATATKIVSGESIRNGVTKEVAKSTEWIRKHPFDPGLLHEKTTKRVSLFSEESGEE